MRMPFVRGTLDAATQVARYGCEAIVDLEYLESYSDNFADLTGWTVVEETAGNVSVSGGVVTMFGTTNGLGKNGIWHTAGGVPGYIKFNLEVTTNNANSALLGFYSDTALPSGLTGSPHLWHSALLNYLRQGNQNVRTGSHAINTVYNMKIVVEQSLFGDGFCRVVYFRDGVLAADSQTSASLIPTVNPIITFQSGNTAARAKYSNYSEHFGGFATTSPTVPYVADAGVGKKWNNFNLTNMAFDNGLVSPNAEFQYYYGDDASPTWSSELTLAQLQAVGDLTGQYRYAMIQVVQNSDGLEQCPVTEVNALDATEGQAAGGGYRTRARTIGI